MSKRLVFSVTESENISISLTPKSPHEVAKCFHVVASKLSPVSCVDVESKKTLFCVTGSEAILI
jgi:hypothetical protein